MRGLAYKLYLVFVVSWFLHITERLPALGVIRLDLLMIVAISLLIFTSSGGPDLGEVSNTDKILKIIFIYIIVTLPLVEWPGSVIKQGLERYIKAIVFFYFTISLIDTVPKLKTFMSVFLLAQTFRVFEPVILHITTGYWGSVAHMSNWEFMDRLSGAPSDVVNPNGLAFIILTVFPFLHFLSSTSSRYKWQYIISAPVLLYALALTASRSGMACFLIVLYSFWKKSNRKGMMVAFIVLGGIVAFGKMSANLQDRYRSIFDKNTNNAATSEGRIAGMKRDFRVAMRRPLFGHGLGCSKEANENFGNEGKLSHNLYAEVAQELGFVGLFLFIMFMRSIIRNYKKSEVRDDMPDAPFLHAIVDGMQAWIWMNIIFSFASFGFSSYEWYLFGGLSLVMKRLTHHVEAESEEPKDAAHLNDPYAWNTLDINPLNP